MTENNDVLNGQKDEISTDYIPVVTHEELQKMREEQASRKLNISFPPDHFIEKFFRWMSSITDAYPEYIFLGGFWLLSALCKGKVILKLKQETVRPNLWIMLLGQSTTSRKTTVVEKSKMVLETVTGETLYNDDYSLEGYLELLQVHPVSNFVRDEAAGLLAKMHQKHNQGIIEAECAIYEGQSYRKTLSSGRQAKAKEVVVNNPYVTKLYATTPDNFSSKMTLEDFDCGYGYRFLYTYPRYSKERKPLGMKTKEDADFFDEVIKRARKLANLFEENGEIKFSVDKDAMLFLDKAMAEMEQKADEYEYGAYATAIGRAQVHILKLAMLIEIGKEKANFTITLETMQMAARMVFEYFIPTLMDIYSQIQEDIKYNNIEKITYILRKMGGSGKHSEVLKKSKVVAKIFKECISTMIESATIKVVKEEKTGLTHYVLTRDHVEKENNPQILKIPSIPQLSDIEENRENFENSISNEDKENVSCTIMLNNVRELENLGNYENSEKLSQHIPLSEMSDNINKDMEKNVKATDSVSSLEEWY